MDLQLRLVNTKLAIRHMIEFPIAVTCGIELCHKNPGPPYGFIHHSVVVVFASTMIFCHSTRPKSQVEFFCSSIVRIASVYSVVAARGDISYMSRNYQEALTICCRIEGHRPRPSSYSSSCTLGTRVVEPDVGPFFLDWV